MRANANAIVLLFVVSSLTVALPGLLAEDPGASTGPVLLPVRTGAGAGSPFAPGALGAITVGPTIGGGSRANVNEVEPNNNVANTVAVGDVVSGNLATTPALDSVDAFAFRVTPGMAINVSLYVIDWDAGNVTTYDANLLLSNSMVGTDWEGSFFSAWGGANNRRNESSSILAQQDTFYFAVVFAFTDGSGNPQTAPVRYQLTITQSAPQQVGTGNQVVNLNGIGPNNFKWFELTTPIDNEVRLQLSGFGGGVDWDMWTFNTWGTRWLNEQQGSLPFWLKGGINTNGAAEDYTVRGGDGKIVVMVWAKNGLTATGQFSVSMTADANNDGNNNPAKAVAVIEDYSTQSQLDEVSDHFDWYKISMNSGKRFNVTVGFQGAAGNDLYNVSLWDSTFALLNARFNTQTGDRYQMTTNKLSATPTQWSRVASCTCDYFLVIYPVHHVVPPQGNVDKETPINGDYTVSIQIENHGPSLSTPLSDVTQDEDAVPWTMNVTTKFADPEGDVLTFTVMELASKTASTPTDTPWALTEIGASSGLLKVTLSPDANGVFYIRALATDPTANTGALTASSTFTFTVNAINDAPAVQAAIGSLTMDEGEILTDDLYPGSLLLADLFSDVDNTDAELTLSVSGNARIPVQVDPVTNAYTFGPATLWFGKETVTITATDPGGKTGSFTFEVRVDHVNHMPLPAGGEDRVTKSAKEDLGGATTIKLITDVRELFTDADVADSTYQALTRDAVTVEIDPENTPHKLTVELSNATHALTIVGMEKDWSGIEEIGLIATDTYDTSTFVTIEVKVDPVNDAPRLVSSTPPANATVEMDEGNAQQFKITVVDVDNDVVREVTYQWYVNDEAVSGERGTTFLFETDFDSKTDTPSADTYTVKVEAKDPSGEMVSQTWDLEVADVNQAPTGVKIKLPATGASFTTGKPITMEAETATDLDGDILTYRWTLKETNASLGEGQTATFAGKPAIKTGTYTLVLTVDDGKGGSTTTLVPIAIKKAKEKPPGFEAVGLLAAVAVALALLRRRKEP